LKKCGLWPTGRLFASKPSPSPDQVKGRTKVPGEALMTGLSGIWRRLAGQNSDAANRFIPGKILHIAMIRFPIGLVSAVPGLQGATRPVPVTRPRSMGPRRPGAL
jgi:hypothetical protein